MDAQDRHVQKQLWGREIPRTFAVSAVSAAIVLVILAVVFTAQGVAPFGASTRTLACMDAAIQYSDFISWYQDVFHGEGSVLYSFTKGLGANAIALFSYYLSSPFNLFFLLVPKESIQVMFDIVVMLKLAAASITASIFLCKRFNAISLPLASCLSISYALMQYSIAQSSNIMWLDGVYMLPMMALFASKLVEMGRGMVPLSVVTGLAILFNWYSGAINCLFLILWFFFELINYAEVSNVREACRYVLSRGLRFAAAMLLGVGLSMILLLPTAFSLLGGRATSGALVSLAWGEFLGNPLKFFGGIVVGSVSNPDFASFYCGSVVIIGCGATFLSRKVAKRTRVAAFVFAGILVLSCYYQPLFTLFSLLISASSYWFRYGYICIFGFAALAGIYFDACSDTRLSNETADVASLFGLPYDRLRSHYVEALLVSILLALAVIGFYVLRPLLGLSQTVVTCIALISAGTLLSLIGRDCGNDSITNIKKMSRGWASLVLPIALVAVLGAELGLNALLLLPSYSIPNVEDRAVYVHQQAEQIDDLLGERAADYRVNQYPTYLTADTGLTANYNEGLAFGYPTVATYSSDPVDSQRQLLNAFGYPICGENMNVVNTPNLAADSLLGVRYYLLDGEMPGLVSVEGVAPANGKSAYLNPFALPLAFPINVSLPEELPVYDGNPFVFINGVYSALLGRNVELFIPVPASNTSEVQGSRGVTTFTLAHPGVGMVLYGNICLSDQWIPSILHVNGREFGYSQWLSPTVFYIDKWHPMVTIDADAANAVVDAQFYALDLELLGAVAQELQSHGDARVQLGTNSATVDIDNTEGMPSLFTSIPLDDGWTVAVNGQRVSPGCAYGCFMTIPLTPGENQIELSFTPRGFSLGCVITALSAICIGAISALGARRKHFTSRDMGDDCER